MITNRIMCCYTGRFKRILRSMLRLQDSDCGIEFDQVSVNAKGDSKYRPL